MAKAIGFIKFINNKTMKKNLLMFAAAVMLAACTGNKELETVKQFANDFATKVSNNQVDSIRALYPDAALCDSFALSFVLDSISVEKNEETGNYHVLISDGIDFVISFMEDNQLFFQSEIRNILEQLMKAE